MGLHNLLYLHHLTHLKIAGPNLSVQRLTVACLQTCAVSVWPRRQYIFHLRCAMVVAVLSFSLLLCLSLLCTSAFDVSIHTYPMAMPET